MHCNHCGAALPNGAQFCNKCGRAIPYTTAKTGPAASWQGPTAQQPKGSQDRGGATPAPAPAKRNLLLIVTCVFLFLGIAVAGVLLLLSPKDPSSSFSEGLSFEDLMQLAEQRLYQGNYEEAILAYEAALKIDPRAEAAYLGLAEAYGETGQPERAAQVLSDGIQLLEDSAALRSAISSYMTPEELDQLLGRAPEASAPAAAAPVFVPTPEPQPTAAPTPASEVPINKKNIEKLAGICFVLGEFSDVQSLSKEQLLSLLYSGWFHGAFPILSDRFKTISGYGEYGEHSYYEQDVELSAADADAFVREITGVGIPDAASDYSLEAFGVYCSGGTYLIQGNDCNDFMYLYSVEQLGNGQIRAAFYWNIFPDEAEGMIDNDELACYMVMEQASNQLGYRIVSLQHP